MAPDYFAILGLTPGRRKPQEVTSRFLAERARLLRQLDDPAQYAESRGRLDELHLAYAVLRDPRRQEEYLRTRDTEEDPVDTLRGLIAASLENGLLRYSRRQAILDRARELGVNEFQTQLLIAQVQFGEEEITVRPAFSLPREDKRDSRAWARAAGVGVLALAMFLFLVRWLGA